MAVADNSKIAERKQERMLSYEEGKRLLEEALIPVAPSIVARERDQATEAARRIGFPVVMKILSPDIVHKSDVGGVATGLRTEQEVSESFCRMIEGIREKRPDARIDGVIIEKMFEGIEVAIGVTTDPQFGPVLMFGLGGILVELLKDVSFRLIPISPVDAEEMIREVKGFALIQGFRGKEGDPKSLKNILLGVSDLILRHPKITEMDLNPVITSPSGSVVADIRIRVNEWKKEAARTIRSRDQAASAKR